MNPWTGQINSSPNRVDVNKTDDLLVCLHKYLSAKDVFISNTILSKRTMHQDPEFAEMSDIIRSRVSLSEKHHILDVATRRQAIQFRYSCVPSGPSSYESSHVRIVEHSIQSFDGETIKIYEFANANDGINTNPSSAILFIHGGGMMMGGALDSQSLLAQQVSETGAHIFSIDYRLAPEFPHPVPVEDCYSALLWLFQNPDKLRIDKKRIAVMGESAGGGLAAGVSLLARDRKTPCLPLAKQILIEPMLDDTNTVSRPYEKFATWTYDDNLAGWTALLGDQVGNHDVPPYAAPSRAVNLLELPPTYLDVGGLDIFCSEGIRFATDILAAGTDVELHVYPGVPHAFTFLCPKAKMAIRARENRLNAIRSV